MIQEFRKKPIRPHLADKKARMEVIDQIVNSIKDICYEQSLILHDFSEVPERLPMIKINLEKKNLSPENADL